MPHHSQQRPVAAAPKLGRCIQQPPRKQQQHQAGPPPLYQKLLVAVLNKDVDGVQYLLEHNCREDVEAALKQPAGPQSGLTPLQAAALRNSSPIVKLLLDAGAPVDARSGSYDEMWRCVQQHCLRNRYVVRALRYCLGDHSTALHFAARTHSSTGWHKRPHTTCLEVLLAHGATIDARDGSGRTPLEVVACSRESEAAARVLCSAGANFFEPPSYYVYSGDEQDADATLLSLMVRCFHSYTRFMEYVVDLVSQRPAPQQYGRQQRRGQRQRTQQQRQVQQSSAGSSSSEPQSWLASLSPQHLEELVIVAARDTFAGALPRLLQLVGPLPEALAARLLDVVFGNWRARRDTVNWEAVLAVLRSCGSLACFSQVDAEVLSRVVEDATRCSKRPAAAAVVHELLLVRPPPLTLEALYYAMSSAVYAEPLREAGQGASGQRSPGQQPLPDPAGMGVLAALLERSATLPTFRDLSTQERPLRLYAYAQNCPFAWLATRPLYPHVESSYSARTCHPRHIMAVAELLRGAGYRPMTFAHAYKASSSELVHNYCPLVDDPECAGSELGRLVRLVVEQPCWAPKIHSKFPEPFKLAVRTLMLAVHRASSRPQTSGATSSGTGLCDLPPELLHKIVGMAAWPLSAWV